VTELFKGQDTHPNNKFLIKTDPACLWWW